MDASREYSMYVFNEFCITSSFVNASADINLKQNPLKVLILPSFASIFRVKLSGPDLYRTQFIQASNSSISVQEM